MTCTGYETEEYDVTNPVLIVEVLSPSNRAETWLNVWSYTTIPSLSEILILSSTAIKAELLRPWQRWELARSRDRNRARRPDPRQYRPHCSPGSDLSDHPSRTHLKTSTFAPKSLAEGASDLGALPVSVRKSKAAWPIMRK